MTGTKEKRDYLYSLLINEKDVSNRTLYLNQRLCTVRVFCVNPNYINKIIKEERLLNSIFSQATGTANQANIGMLALKNWVLPLPPLAEQNRIVTKLDELTFLCEKLKKRLLKSQEIQTALSKTIVENAVV
ncbi:MAG: hypothetical protein EOP48_03735 [Sphingobacteriales bacterium]|nr:MAG: hypothetical protein EOP48_03735 [Sphingobacteriales bacterium]